MAHDDWTVIGYSHLGGTTYTEDKLEQVSQNLFKFAAFSLRFMAYMIANDVESPYLCVALPPHFQVRSDFVHLMSLEGTALKKAYTAVLDPVEQFTLFWVNTQS